MDSSMRSATRGFGSTKSTTWLVIGDAATQTIVPCNRRFQNSSLHVFERALSLDTSRRESHRHRLDFRAAGPEVRRLAIGKLTALGFGVAEDEWRVLQTARPNVLLIGADRTVADFLALLLPLFH